MAAVTPPVFELFLGCADHMAFECVNCGSKVGDGPRGTYKNRVSERCRKCETNRRQFLRCISKWEERACLHCGVRFSSAKMRYCEKACRIAAWALLAAEKRVTARLPEMEADCHRCGVHFSYTHTGTRRRFCGRLCGKRASEEIRRSQAAANDNRQPPIAAAYKVLRASGWVCAACGQDTPEQLRGTHELNAPEIDHVVPLSRGGTHDYDNLQCLCKSCNSSKGAKLMSEWSPSNDNSSVSEGGIAPQLARCTSNHIAVR